MKKLITSIALMIVLIQGVFAQGITTTISGTVTNSVNSSPMANQAIYIVADSSNFMLFSYSNTVYTNANGFYTATLTIPNTPVITFYVSTSNCNGAMVTNTVTSSTLPMVSNFTIQCNPQSCYADLSFSTDSMNPGMTFYFYDQSFPAGGNITSWLWNFGDGTSSTLQYPQHTYTTPGTNYMVCLTIATSLGCSSTHCDTIHADTANTGNCQASFQYSVNNTDVYFYGYSSSSGSSYLWNFGDSTTSTLQNPIHTFSTNGTYSVCLTITTNNGCINTYCETIALGNPIGCPATFYTYQDTANYMNYYFYASNGLPSNETCSWYFGDGSSSTLVDPVHLFANMGSYSVCLTIYDSLSNILCTYCDSVIVDSANTQGCQAYFNYSVSGNDVTFYGYGSNISSYNWSFADGTGSSIQDPVHTYANTGSFYVCLTIACSNGTTNTYCDYVTVGSVGNSYLCGHVYAGVNYADLGYAVLIGLDSMTNAYNYNYTTTIDSMGGYCFYNVLPGNYIVLASLTPNSAYYNNYLPTYYGDVTDWANATFIYVPSSTTLTGYDVNLVSTSFANNGGGSIGGNCMQGGNKTPAPGDPLSGIEILLLDASGTPLASTLTDSWGNFMFSNLPWGTYKIYAEIAGLNCTPGVVTINASNPTVSNVLVTVSSTGIVASISDELSEFVSSVGSIYPNPATDNATINISMLKATEITVSIYNVMGQMTESYKVATNNGMFKVPVNVKNLTEGIYSVQLTTADGLKIVRQFMKMK